MAWNDLLWFAMVRYGMESFIMVCHGMVLENPWDMLTNMLTVDTTTGLGQVDMSLCIHTLFIYGPKAVGREKSALRVTKQPSLRETS